MPPQLGLMCMQCLSVCLHRADLEAPVQALLRSMPEVSAKALGAVCARAERVQSLELSRWGMRGLATHAGFASISCAG